jgi:hypothetical protein
MVLGAHKTERIAVTRRSRTARFVFLLAVLCGLLLTAPVQAQTDGPLTAASKPGEGVGELWKEYPLRDATRTPGAGTAGPGGRSTPAPAPAGRSRPGGVFQGGRKAKQDGGTSELPIVALVVIVALAVGLALRVRRRAIARRGSAEAEGQLRLDRPDYVEGTSDRNDIGAFAGYVEYEQREGTVPDAERMVLVHDSSRNAPVWVTRAEISARRVGDEPFLPSGEGIRPSGRFAQTSRRFARPSGTHDELITRPRSG